MSSEFLEFRLKFLQEYQEANSRLMKILCDFQKKDAAVKPIVTEVEDDYETPDWLSKKPSIPKVTLVSRRPKVEEVAIKPKRGALRKTK